ncbi:MAG: hypothetical protein ACYTEG_03705 [Planctomycetota bacterium]
MIRALLVLLLLLAGCIRLDYVRTLVDEPVPDEKFETLSPGASLQSCLDTLGAPALVWNDPRGIWFAYIWINERGPRVSASVPLLAFALPGPSPSITYSHIKRRGEGVTLCFDNDLNLRFARRGLTNLPDQYPQ